MDIVQLAISVCHASAKHPKSRPTEALRSHSYHPQFPRVLGNSDCATAPLFPPGQMMAPPSTGVAGESEGTLPLAVNAPLASDPQR
jgi:hypothetical protein